MQIDIYAPFFIFPGLFLISTLSTLITMHDSHTGEKTPELCFLFFTSLNKMNIQDLQMLCIKGKGWIFFRFP